MPKHGPNVWVIRSGDEYSVKEEGTRKPLIPPVAQETAIRIARLIARANRSELFIQNQQGRIRARDSHGFDTSPPRG